MIVEYGIIVERKSAEIASVLCRKQSACQHCPSSAACQTGDDDRSMRVEAFNTIGAEVGDRVQVETSTRHFLQSSFILYIIPVFGLIVGALAGQLIGENFDIGLDPTLLSALLGVAFLVGTFLCIRVGSRALKREMFMPRITALQSETEPLNEEIPHNGN